MEGQTRVALCEIERGREARTVQGDRHAIAGQRRDDADLIAEAEQILRIRRPGPVEETVWDLVHSQRAIEERRRALKTLCHGRRLPAQLGEQGLPAPAGSVEAAPRDEEAQIGLATLHELQAGIAAREQHDLDDPVQGGALRCRQGEIGLEGDEIVPGSAAQALGAPDVVLATRQKDGSGPDLSEARPPRGRFPPARP